MFPASYPYWISRTEDGFRFTFPTIPEASFDAESAGAGMQELSSRVLEAIQNRLKQDAPPAFRRAYSGESVFELAPTHQTKLMLIDAARRKGVRPADMARILGVAPQEGQRILNFLHPTKMDTMANALKELGCRVRVSLEEDPLV